MLKLITHVCSQVEASDPDEGVNGQVTYSIDGGNQDGYFSISADTGEVTLAKVIPLEENRFLRFSLYVTAKDGKPPFPLHFRKHNEDKTCSCRVLQALILTVKKKHTMDHELLPQ